MKHLLLFVIVLVCISCVKNETTKPQFKPLVEAVYASGNVLAKGQYTIYSQAEGYITEEVVEEGGIVKKGDPVFIIESGQQSSRFDLARKSYAIALNNFRTGSPVLREAEAALAVSKSKVDFDSVNFVRFSNLYQQNATTKAEFDRAKLAYENSRNELRLQQSRYIKLKDQLSLELENAKSQLSIAGLESGKYIVRSELDGRVLMSLKALNELVHRGEALAIIGDSSDYFLELAVDERDILKVERGQKILVTIDAFPNRMFKATVTKVYPYVNRQQQSVRVDASLDEKLPMFYTGLAVEANIILRENKNALVIPVRALRGDSVLVSGENGDEYVRVKTGIMTLEEAEIVEGLTEGSEVILTK
jgi:HlyD family secretion protein